MHWWYDVATGAQVEGALWHYGGKMHWGPDHHLYLSLGDKYRPDHAQRADKCVSKAVHLVGVG